MQPLDAGLMRIDDWWPEQKVGAGRFGSPNETGGCSGVFEYRASICMFAGDRAGVGCALRGDEGGCLRLQEHFEPWRLGRWITP
mgnify:CR=1 FL=1